MDKPLLKGVHIVLRGGDIVILSGVTRIFTQPDKTRIKTTSGRFRFSTSSITHLYVYTGRF